MLYSPQTGEVFYLPMRWLRSSGRYKEKRAAEHMMVAGEQMDFLFPVRRVVGADIRDSHRVGCWNVYWSKHNSTLFSVNNGDKARTNHHRQQPARGTRTVRLVCRARDGKKQGLQQACVVRLKQKPAPWMFVCRRAWPLTFPWPLICISAKGEEKYIVTGRNKD